MAGKSEENQKTAEAKTKRKRKGKEMDVIQRRKLKGEKGFSLTRIYSIPLPPGKSHKIKVSFLR